MELSDAEVVRQVLAGDARAFDVLVDRYYDRYARFARHMTGSQEDAEEALQDAFVRAYHSLRRYQERERFGAWLFRILANRCRTATHRAKRHAAVMTDDSAPGAEGRVEHTESNAADREEIERALAVLPPEQREAFVLKYVDELEYEEMTRLTGVGVSALKMRVKRACERLRVLLGEGETR